MADRSLRPPATDPGPRRDPHLGDESAHLAPDLGPAGLRAFFRIAEAWGLSQQQQCILLGAPSRQTLHNWRHEKGVNKLSRDLLDRLSYILGIYKALHIIYADPGIADDWMNRPHASFSDQPPISVALRGSIMDLAQLRRYLDSVRT